MPSKKQIRESMTRFDIFSHRPPVTVRIWRNEPLKGAISTDALRKAAEDIGGKWTLRTRDLFELAKAISAIDSEISAVEVLDPVGQGVVFYPDWT